MKLVSIAAVVMAATFTTMAAAEEIAKIDQATLLKRIESKDASLLVLDVRTPEEFAAGHIPGAINIPHTHLPARIAELPAAAEKDIVVYCASGVRSEKAIASFRDNGYTRLVHLDGDMQRWQESRRPIEK